MAAYFHSDFKGDSPDDYKQWRHILSTPIDSNKSKALLREVLSGLTVALAQIPEAVAFSFTAGVDPIVGLHAAWIICLITALWGGAPGMISGATGAIAVVLREFVEQNGVGHLFIAIILMGLFQIFLGLIGAGKLVKLIGAPTMIGFVNGLAIIIFLAQFHTFKLEKCPGDPEHTVYDYFKGCWQEGDVIGWQSFLIFITMFVIYFLPRFTKAFPASLAGIILATIIEHALMRQIGYETPLVKDLASVSGSFPIPIWLDDNYNQDTNETINDNIPSLLEASTYKAVWRTSLILALIGLVESLLTLQLVSEITKRKGSTRAECLAQGVANVLTGIFGGMGGCAMIGQSMINVKSGGVTRISSATAGIVLLLIILAASTLIEQVPIAALTGVMFMVVIGTFDWDSIPLILSAAFPSSWRNHEKLSWHKKVKRTDVIIIVIVTTIAVLEDLAVAVGAGVALAAIFFAWEQSQSHNFIIKQSATFSKPNSGYKVYEMHGPLFFATSQLFEASFNAHEDSKAGVKLVDVDVSEGSLSDFSALTSINNVAKSYAEHGVEFRLRGVKENCLNMITKAKHLIFSHSKQKTAEENELELKQMMTKISSSYSATGVRKVHDGEFQLPQDDDEKKDEIEKA